MDLKSQLKTRFGFDSFKQGQQPTIEKILQGHSAAAIFPTGSGKSLCYQLPALQLEGVTLVVSPLLSLMKDQLDFLHSKKISAARLDSTLGRAEYNQVLHQAKTNQLKILMISVERFKNERFRTQLKQMKISLMVIDEAHCISEWGHNFRPDYLKLPLYQQQFHIPHVLLLTATATRQVIHDMQNKFSIADENVVTTGFYRSNLYLQMSPSPEESREPKLLARINKNPQAPTIIYVTLQKTAVEVAEYLQQNAINAQHYHAGMKPEEREQIQNDFMDGKIHCVVATIAFGMGIDKSDVRRVIHYDLPKSIENYSQEIGRAGRDGEKSLCEIMANADNLCVQENFVYGDTPEKQSIDSLLSQIQQTAENFWEIKLVSLSNELNIRLLPLKTLLVYLEMEGILSPKYTYFEEYSFTNVDTQSIISRFSGERKEFIAAIFSHCVVKKKYTTVDMQSILTNYSTDRNRVITALEFLDEQELIELQAKQSVERFEITSKNFDKNTLAEKMHNLFVSKETVEIQRIQQMLEFFGSDACLSLQLANYFGQTLSFEKCGHCSWCQSGKAGFESKLQLKPLQSYDFKAVTDEFISAVGEAYTDINLCRFLCGINTPVFKRYKIKSLQNFAVFENYPYAHVRDWVKENTPV